MIYRHRLLSPPTQSDPLMTLPPIQFCVSACTIRLNDGTLLVALHTQIAYGLGVTHLNITFAECCRGGCRVDAE